MNGDELDDSDYVPRPSSSSSSPELHREQASLFSQMRRRLRWWRWRTRCSPSCPLCSCPSGGRDLLFLKTPTSSEPFTPSYSPSWRENPAPRGASIFFSRRPSFRRQLLKKVLLDTSNIRQIVLLLREGLHFKNKTPKTSEPCREHLRRVLDGSFEENYRKAANVLGLSPLLSS